MANKDQDIESDSKISPKPPGGSTSWSRFPMSSLKLAVEIFDGTGHFGMWQGEVLDSLFQQGLDIAIEEKKPEEIEDKDWKIITRLTCGTIRSCLYREQKYAFKNETSAHKLWKALEDKFLKKSGQNKLLMKKRLFRFDYKQDLSEGLPDYPLCNRLALALLESIINGAFCTTCKNMPLINEDTLLKQREKEWDQLIVEEGSELVNSLKNVVFELHVQEPYFSYLKDGYKTIEGRCAIGNYNRIGPGDIILVNKCVAFAVQGVHHYASFYEMLKAEDLAKVIPGVETIEEGVQIYRTFYSEEKERSNGVIAICVSKLVSQPYTLLARLLSGLGYWGIQSLLGIAHTVGTIFDALPPPRSTLISSFLLPYKPKVNSLSYGARAMAKHAGRSSENFWGRLIGNDQSKNRLALDVIKFLMLHCCWSNVHLVQPHGAVFEIRVHDGYGARWSADGTKFIGFLEPFMEDGHSKGWKH